MKTKYLHFLRKQEALHFYQALPKKLGYAGMATTFKEAFPRMLQLRAVVDLGSNLTRSEADS